MGAWLSSPAEAEAPRETLRFHAKAKGAQVQLEALHCIARRRSTFHDGIVFSQRPLQPDERVALRVLWYEDCWCGGLRVGFTRLDPARVPALSLPPFLCPDLEQLSPTWAAVLPNHWVFPGNVIRFWVNRSGWLFASINAGPQLLLRKGVRMGAPLWAVMDVYGTTKAIQLLDPTASAFPTGGTFSTTTPWDLYVDLVSELEDTAGGECAICFHRAANSCLVPCGHTLFCSSCAWRVFWDTAKCPVCRCGIKRVTSA
ncbi:E3 ubiquitin-protein ligase NEURL3 [Manis javanica]|uniref:E3 ubiquitin-protein ligase NEURL3 n=1 Tax=Manis javanica TaxID=9974 RepID=UPI003C6D91C7